jgi:SAM-dependent methyltransferase
MGSPLTFPPPPGFDDPVVWDGQRFHIGGKEEKVLAYDVGDSGWTDELTTFHEETAGANHYIDLASRRHAVNSVRRWAPNPRPVVLDIGCSSGFLLRDLASSILESVLIGSDYVKGPLENLAAQLPGIPLLQFDITECPLPENSVDVAVLLNVLEHIADDTGAMKQVRRILRPGGAAIIEVPAGPELYDIYDKQLMHRRRYRMRDLLEVLEAAALETVYKSFLGFFIYPPFWLVKKWNRRLLDADRAVQRAQVQKNIRQQIGNPLLHGVMKLEEALRPYIRYPIGIRCLAVARKPEIKSNG